jgi:enoyl-CoA hydratase/carnithine racemase
MPTYETLLSDVVAPGVVVVALNRPDRLNAMTNTMFAELEQVARTLDQDVSCRAVVLTGAGSGFCSGYDLADADGLPGLGALGMLDQQERAARAMQAVRSLRKPVIAAVNGAAAGGGFALALTADIRIAGPRARFNAAFTRIGLSAGDLGTSWLLTRLVGPAVASDICFTGRSVDADEAWDRGIVNSVADDPLQAATDLAVASASLAPGGVQFSKRALQANLEAGSLAAAMELETRGQALLAQTPDMFEALAAVLEKRPPNFTGA